MPWVEVFAVFVVSHLVGDYIFQTDFQAVNKHGGLTGTATQRRALFTHILTYTTAFVPALIWLADSRGAGLVWVVALIAIPHLIQDDGRLLNLYALKVKKADLIANPSLGRALDQAFHILVLFGLSLLAGR